MITLAEIGIHLPPIAHTGAGYNGWLASQRCAIPGCGLRQVELHHTAAFQDIGRKTHSLRRYTPIPLCAAHHRHARYSIHSLIRPGAEHNQDRTRREDRQLVFLGARPAAELLRGYYRAYAGERNIRLPAPSSARALAHLLLELEVA